LALLPVDLFVLASDRKAWLATLTPTFAIGHRHA